MEKLLGKNHLQTATPFYDIIFSLQSSNIHGLSASGSGTAGLRSRALGPWGWTPLHWAAYRGRLQVVERLVAAGADVDIKQSCGCRVPSEKCGKWMELGETLWKSWLGLGEHFADFRWIECSWPCFEKKNQQIACRLHAQTKRPPKRNASEVRRRSILLGGSWPLTKIVVGGARRKVEPGEFSDWGGWPWRFLKLPGDFQWRWSVNHSHIAV